jgi:hypothetical protein
MCASPDKLNRRLLRKTCIAQEGSTSPHPLAQPNSAGLEGPFCLHFAGKLHPVPFFDLSKADAAKTIFRLVSGPLAHLEQANSGAERG